ncbi:hypothetical protein ACLOJK_011780 [Asimina triloba]
MAESLQCRFPATWWSSCPRISSPILPFSRKASILTPIPRISISCRLRGGRKPLWRSRVLSTEAIQAVQHLKLAKSTSKLEEVFYKRLSRLLKADVIAVLDELRRQNEWEMALKVFKFVQKEVWYSPDLSLYSDMIMVLGRNKLIEIAEELFSELKKEGLKPDTRAYTEMIGIYLRMGMVEKAMETYTLMKESGCVPDKLTLTILITNLEKAGEEELVSAIKRECADYMDFPRKFLDKVKENHGKESSTQESFLVVVVSTKDGYLSLKTPVEHASHLIGRLFNAHPGSYLEMFSSSIRRCHDLDGKSIDLCVFANSGDFAREMIQGNHVTRLRFEISISDAWNEHFNHGKISEACAISSKEPLSTKACC